MKVIQELPVESSDRALRLVNLPLNNREEAGERAGGKTKVCALIVMVMSSSDVILWLVHVAGWNQTNKTWRFRFPPGSWFRVAPTNVAGAAGASPSTQPRSWLHETNQNPTGSTNRTTTNERSDQRREESARTWKSFKDTKRSRQLFTQRQQTGGYYDDNFNK